MRSLVVMGALALAGCGPDTKATEVQPVRIVANDFCRQMKAVLPPSGKPRWSIADRPETRTDARKIGETVDARCGVPRASGG